MILTNAGSGTLFRKVERAFGKMNYDDTSILEEYHSDMAKLEKM